MPDRELLEVYPLYRKRRFSIEYTSLSTLPKAAVHMECAICKSDQTFNMANEYYEGRQVANEFAPGQICRLVYVCMACKRGVRVFVVRFDPDGKSAMKIGQYPPWDVRPDPNLEQMLGELADLYKKGLVCESQGYGIGAFGYYRRIVEKIIGKLLDDVAELLASPERDAFVQALERVRATTVAQEKIALVKDLLPASLRPDGINPLAVLHDTLSEGLHEVPDEDCMELAAGVRETLVFLVDQVAATRERRKDFTAGMRKLLERKVKKDA